MTSPKTQPADKAAEEAELGDIVVIESGPFAGWLGEYDADSGSSYLVVPLHPLTRAPYVVARRVRALTAADQDKVTNGAFAMFRALQPLARVISGTLGAEAAAGLEAVFAEAVRLVRSRESSSAKIVAERARPIPPPPPASAPRMPTVFTPGMHERKSRKP